MFENDIVQDAYYLINKFNENEKQVSNMQIQKLMYFFEAYYMNRHPEVDRLYDCNFNAWAFGPVSIPLYKEFRKFGNGDIQLTEENIHYGNEIEEEKKKLLDNMYNKFKNTPAIELVEFTHMKNSPWSEVWQKNGEKVGYGTNTYIDKQKSKEWFKNTFAKRD